MSLNILRYAIACSAVLGGVAACGGGSAESTLTPAAQSATVPLSISDASSDDWATIGVKVLGIALLPQGGGAAVSVYSAPATAPLVNLAQLDQISELLGNIVIPTGTYTGAVLTIGGNPGDVLLTTSADPESGFGAAPATTIASSQIRIQHTRGTAPDLTVSVKVNFESALVVGTAQNNALDLEFDLAHPAFIVEHQLPGAINALWAVNFNGPVRRHPIADVTRLVLRHLYGSVSAVAGDNSSITIGRELPTLPIQTPETAAATGTSLQILVDSANGTLYYDVDAKTSTTIRDFSAEAANLVGRYVRVAARYQQNGTLVATRLWVSSTFNSVWLSPEGQVLHVNTANNVITVQNESGVGVPLTVNANTGFYFRTPSNALADATPIGTGTAFLASQNLVRGFKVHATVIDPLATPLVAQSIDIETARYSGQISQANTVSATYTHRFARSADDYAYALDYISPTTANGKDAAGNAISGFKWWNFAYPTQLTSGSSAVADFVTTTGGSVNFGGTAGAVSAVGVGYAVWGDSANPSGWSSPASILLPVSLPLGTVASGYASGSFSMNITGGAPPAIIDVSSSSGSATLVYQVDRSSEIVSVSSVDITTSTGLATLAAGLAVGTPVKLYGVPQADGTLRAYVLLYFTGAMPAN